MKFKYLIKYFSLRIVFDPFISTILCNILASRLHKLFASQL